MVGCGTLLRVAVKPRTMCGKGGTPCYVSPLQAYDASGAPMWACDATQDAGSLAAVFSAHAAVTSDSVDAAEEDALSLGRLNLGVLSTHVYEVGLAKSMVETGVNRFHGGSVVAMVPVARLDIPGNLRRLQTTLCEARSLSGHCCGCASRLVSWSPLSAPCV